MHGNLILGDRLDNDALEGMLRAKDLLPLIGQLVILCHGGRDLVAGQLGQNKQGHASLVLLFLGCHFLISLLQEVVRILMLKTVDQFSVHVR